MMRMAVTTVTTIGILGTAIIVLMGTPATLDQFVLLGQPSRMTNSIVVSSFSLNRHHHQQRLGRLRKNVLSNVPSTPPSIASGDGGGSDVVVSFTRLFSSSSKHNINVLAPTSWSSVGTIGRGNAGLFCARRTSTSSSSSSSHILANHHLNDRGHYLYKDNINDADAGPLPKNQARSRNSVVEINATRNFSSVAEAAIELGMARGTMYDILNRRRLHRGSYYLYQGNIADADIASLPKMYDILNRRRIHRGSYYLYHGNITDADIASLPREKPKCNKVVTEINGTTLSISKEISPVTDTAAELGIAKRYMYGVPKQNRSREGRMYLYGDNNRDAEMAPLPRQQAERTDVATPMSSSVAIIGGGIAGLSCAQRLSSSSSSSPLTDTGIPSRHRYDVTVFDTGRLRPGGRASSRQPNDPKSHKENNDEDYPILSKYRYDHAAQLIAVPQEKQLQPSNDAEILPATTSLWRDDFDRQVNEWIYEGVLLEAPLDSMYVFSKQPSSSAASSSAAAAGRSDGSMQPPPASSRWEAECMTMMQPGTVENGSSSAEDTDHRHSSSSSFPPKCRFYYPKDGMSALAQTMVPSYSSSSSSLSSNNSNNFTLNQDVWVSPTSGVRYEVGKGVTATILSTSNTTTTSTSKSNNKWVLQGNGRILGRYDHLIIAHNGKCADRLLQKAPCTDVHRLLRVNFNNRVVPGTGSTKMTLNSIYSLTVCIDSQCLSETLPPTFMAGFVTGHPIISMITCQTRKYPSTYSPDGKGTGNTNTKKNFEVWNMLSTATFAKKFKAPQEFLPSDVVEDVTQRMLDAAQAMILGGGNGEPPSHDGTTTSPLSPNLLRDHVVESRLQLWGAAVPLNVWKGRSTGSSHRVTADGTGTGFIYDPEYQVGVCGDWLMDPSIAGAWTSGRRLADYLLSSNRASDDKIGIDGYFQASPQVQRAGIASFDIGGTDMDGTSVEDYSKNNSVGRRPGTGSKKRRNTNSNKASDKKRGNKPGGKDGSTTNQRKAGVKGRGSNDTGVARKEGGNQLNQR